MTQKKTIYLGNIYCKLQNVISENELACSEEYKEKLPQETGTNLFQKIQKQENKMN